MPAGDGLGASSRAVGDARALLLLEGTGDRAARGAPARPDDFLLLTEPRPAARQRTLLRSRLMACKIDRGRISRRSFSARTGSRPPTTASPPSRCRRRAPSRRWGARLGCSIRAGRLASAADRRPRLPAGPSRAAGGRLREGCYRDRADRASTTAARDFAILEVEPNFPAWCPGDRALPCAESRSRMFGIMPGTHGKPRHGAGFSWSRGW
jgi:hypothetical protein